MISQSFGGYGGYGGLAPFGAAIETRVPFIPAVGAWGDYGAAKPKPRKAVNPINGKSTKFFDVKGHGGFRYWVWQGKGVSGDITIASWPKNDAPPARERYLRKKDGSARWQAIMSEIGPQLRKAGASDTVAKAGSIVGGLLNQLLPPASATDEEGGAASDEGAGTGLMDGPGKYVVIGVGALVGLGILAAALKS